jgi:hypothetical protein
MECKFSKSRNRDDEAIRLDDQEIPKRESFRYLGSIIHKDREIEENANNRIRAGWVKWRCATGVLCDSRIPIKLKKKFYKTTIRQVILYGTIC